MSELCVALQKKLKSAKTDATVLYRFLKHNFNLKLLQVIRQLQISLIYSSVTHTHTHTQTHTQKATSKIAVFIFWCSEFCKGGGE
jgi:hypothetical protein